MAEPGLNRALDPPVIGPSMVRVKVSTRGDYASRALLSLALHADGEGPTSVRDIAERTGLPQPYLEQILLALKGFPEREWATVRELAERLQLRHHSVVELVNRAQTQGLVDRADHPEDARAVRVVPTAQGERVLTALAALHRDELRRMNAALALPAWHGPD